VKPILKTRRLMYKIIMPANRKENNIAPNQSPNESAMLRTVEFIKTGRYLRVISTGRFTLDDHLRMIEEVVSRELWKPGMNVLFDNRNLDYGETSVAMMKAARDNQVKYDERIGDGKAALLMKSIPDFARGRQYEILATEKVSARVRVFRDEKEAIAWLLAPPDESR
jgi:hypothetical protein